MALCWSREDVSRHLGIVPSVYNPEHPVAVFVEGLAPLLECEARLLDRQDCETDPNWLQIIPYITLVEPTHKRLFVYFRGQKSHETRLHGKCSIGVGGHIETPVTDECSIETVILESALRELDEEVGLQIRLEEFCTLSDLWVPRTRLIYVDRDPVGSVHLGLHWIIGVDQHRIKEVEDAVIVQHRWMSVSDIEHALQQSIYFEHWSDVVFHGIQNWSPLLTLAD